MSVCFLRTQGVILKSYCSQLLPSASFTFIRCLKHLTFHTKHTYNAFKFLKTHYFTSIKINSENDSFSSFV